MHIQQIKRLFREWTSSKDASPSTAHQTDPIQQVQLHSSFTCMCCIPDANALNRTEHAHNPLYSIRHETNNGTRV